MNEVKRRQEGLTNKKLAVIIPTLAEKVRISAGNSFTTVLFLTFKECMRMQEKKIKLNAAEDVKEFVQGASRCDFDVDVYYNRILIDAKSILGVLSMDLNRELTVKCHGQSGDFERVLEKFAIA